MSTEMADNPSHERNDAPAACDRKPNPVSRVAALVLLAATAFTAFAMLIGIGAVIAMDMGLSAAPSIAPIPKDDRADAEPVTSPAPRLVLTPPLSIRTTKADRDRMEDFIDDHVRRGGGRLIFEQGKQRAYLTGQETAQTLADHAHGSPDEGRVRPEHYADLRDFLLNDDSGPADTMVVVTVRAPAFENPLFSRIVIAAAFASVTGITIIMLSVVVLGLGETIRESSRSREVNNHGERE